MRHVASGARTRSLFSAEAFANVKVKFGKTVVDVDVVCPGAKDDGRLGETGGVHSIYRAMVFGPDGGQKGPDVTWVAQ